MLEILESRAAAEKRMHRYARNLRSRRQTHRYGVFVEPHRSRHGDTWRVCLKDRGD